MAEAATGRRLALVIATGSYADPTLAKLRAPGQDASDLAAVLEDGAIGGFEVETVLDAPAESLRRRIAQFCAQVGPGDLTLVYLSCHGVLDDRGRLYYATGDTDRSLLAATAVPSAWLNEQLEDCRGRRQILVLDCCHSGAFAKGAKGESDLALGERFEGRGRVVLTGSRGTEYSFEHDQVVGAGTSSVFTGALVEGLRSGDADRDGDGMVTVGELYDYAYETVRSKEGRQTPTLWTYGAEGDLLVAQSPRGAIVEPVPLPEDLTMLLESARPRVREGAVRELADLLASPDAGRALTARTELERVADEDVTSVAAAARAALDSLPAPAEPEPPTPPARQSESTRQPPPPKPVKPPPPTKPPRPPAPSPGGPTRWRERGFRRRAIAIGTLAIAAIVVVVVVVLGAGDDSKTGRIDVEGSPRGVAVDENAAWVTRYDDGIVGKIKRSTGDESQSIKVGPHPDKIAVREGSVWVSVGNGRELVRIDADRNKETTRVDFDGGECECISELGITGDEKLWVGWGVAPNVFLESFNLQTGDELDRFRPGAGFEGEFAVHGELVWAIGNDDDKGSTSWVRWVDSNSGATGKRCPSPEADSSFTGIAYGKKMLWIADSERDVLIPFDPEKEVFGKSIAVEKGISGDDIAAVANGVLAWNADNGWMTRIDSQKMEAVEAQRLGGYQAHETFNDKSSDLGTDEKSAWVTDPLGEAVFRVKYRPKLSGF